VGFAIVNARLWGREGDAVVVKKGRIVGLGFEDSLRGEMVGVKVIDAEGGTVIPLLHDSHAHPQPVLPEVVDLRGVRSIEGVKKVLRSFKLRYKPKYIVGRGWDQELLSEGRMPTADDIDEVVRDVPVILVRVCGHVAVVNSRMLKLAEEAGLLPRYADFIEVVDGRATGVIYEGAIEAFKSLLPKPPDTDVIRGLRRLLTSYLRLGVGYVNFVSVGGDVARLLSRALEGLKPGVRVGIYCSADEVAKGGLEHFSGVRLCGVKDFSDGSLGGRTAYLSSDYSDAPGVRGVLLLSKGRLGVLWRAVKGLGLQLAIHAIGDEAIKRTISWARELKIPGSYLRVEHASVTPPEVIESLRSYRPHVVVQPHFLVTDWWAYSRLGTRVKFLYAYRSLIDASLPLYGSSDYPVEPINPYLSISAAVTRGMLQRYGVEEAITVEEAFEMYFRDPCFGLSRLRPGGEADLALVDGDLSGVSGYDVSGIRPILVSVSGELVQVAKDF